MTDSDQNLTNEQQVLITQITNSIQQSLQLILSKYHIVASESSSQEALNEVCALDNQVSELLAQVNNISSYEISTESLDRDREKLKDLQKELGHILKVLGTLKENVDNLKSRTEDLMLDPQENDILEIITVDLKRKEEHNSVWTVTIRSSTKNKGNFRNVKIVSKSDDSPARTVCTVLLIEPGMTIKVPCDQPIQIGETISAQFDDRLVSKEFYIFSLKIVEVAANNGDVIIKNLSNQDVYNFGIFFGKITSPDTYNIGPYETIRIRNIVPLDAEKIVLFDPVTSTTSSTYFQIRNTISEEFQDDLTPEQRITYNTFIEQNPQADPIQLKMALLKGESFN